MSAALGVYLALAVALTVAALCFLGMTRAAAPVLGASPERWLRWGWVLLGLALLAPLVARVAPSTGHATLELWGGPRLDGSSWSAAPLSVEVRLGPDAATPGARWTLAWRDLALPLLALALGWAWALGHLFWRQHRLGRFCRQLPVVRRLGRVRVCASEAVKTPFAARSGGLAYVVLPLAVVTNPLRFRLVLAHEAQHHRRGDLATARLFAGLRALFFWNPAVARWERVTAEMEDLACDGAVLRRPWVSPLEYGRCLLWAAEQAGPGGAHLTGARAMASTAEGTLRRRISMIKSREAHEQGQRRRGKMAGFLGVIGCLAVLTTAFLVEGAVAERRVNKEEVAATAARIEERTGFVVPIDDQLVAAFDRRLANPDWRAWIRKGLERMPTHRATIEEVLRARGLPPALSAMVLAESAFDDQARTNRPPEQRAAGLWQLMPGTARKLGLSVTPARDERLDPVRATEAAAKYLEELYAGFTGDWALAIAAYNGGTPAVKKVIGEARGTEALDKILALKTELGQYVPAVLIAMLVMENPALLD